MKFLPQQLVHTLYAICVSTILHYLLFCPRFRLDIGDTRCDIVLLPLSGTQRLLTLVNS